MSHLNHLKMKTPATTKQFLPVLIIIMLIFSCNQQPIDPSTTIDDVLLPVGFVQSDDIGPFVSQYQFHHALLPA